MAFWILSSTDGFWRVKQVLGKGDKSLLIETEFVPPAAWRRRARVEAACTSEDVRGDGAKKLKIDPRFPPAHKWMKGKFPIALKRTGVF